VKRKRTRVLPRGVRPCPSAEDCLRRALDALDLGLVVSSLRWCERARSELEGVVSAEADEGDAT